MEKEIEDDLPSDPPPRPDETRFDWPGRKEELSKKASCASNASNSALDCTKMLINKDREYLTVTGTNTALPSTKGVQPSNKEKNDPIYSNLCWEKDHKRPLTIAKAKVCYIKWLPIKQYVDHARTLGCVNCIHFATWGSN